MKKLLLMCLLVSPSAPLLAADATTTAPVATATVTGIPWSSLNSDQQQLLAQFESRWDELPPQRQFALSRGADRWSKMNADEKARASDRFRRWRAMNNQRRALIRERWVEFQNLPVDEQERMRRDFREFQRLSAARRAELRQQWQQKSRAERQQILRDLRERRRERRQGR